jgi:CubicO group peptidase (beta-lactamase class C family)
MRPVMAFVVAALLFTATDLSAQSAAEQGRGNPDVQFAGQSIDAMISAFMKEHGVAGMAVAIVQAPYITRATGFGVGDRDRRTLVSANTIFNIAQMKNAFTAIAVMPKRQFEALGLKHTFFAGDLKAAPREDVRPGGQHRRFLREPALIDPTEPATGYRGTGAATSGEAAIYSSASDISVWDIGLAGDILVKDPALRKILYAPDTLENRDKIPTSGPWFFPGHEGLSRTSWSASRCSPTRKASISRCSRARSPAPTTPASARP